MRADFVDDGDLHGLGEKRFASFEKRFVTCSFVTWLTRFAFEKRFVTWLTRVARKTFYFWEKRFAYLDFHGVILFLGEPEKYDLSRSAGDGQFPGVGVEGDLRERTEFIIASSNYISL